jgi:carbamoyl-phosphate synthase large subunit
MNIHSLNILVTGSCGVTSRSIVRSLKMSSYFGTARFIGTGIYDNLYGLTEGLYDVIYRVPYVTEGDNYTNAIKHVCEQENIHLAIVIPELEVLHWARHQLPVPSLLPPEHFCRVAGSKEALYLALQDSGNIPRFELVTRARLTDDSDYQPPAGWPCWIRDHGLGSTSGRGSFLASNHEELQAWVTLNPGIENFMVSEFLPGRNFACHLLYHQGNLIKTGVYERLAYFMGHLVPSGISGNISRGRLLNDPRVVEVSVSAVEQICRQTGDVMNGMVAVDLREDAHQHPMITEINLRHVACTSAFASAGHNLAEAQAFAALGMLDQVGEREHDYPPGNYILRDIDGPAVWVPQLQVPSINQAAVFPS